MPFRKTQPIGSVPQTPPPQFGQARSNPTANSFAVPAVTNAPTEPITPSSPQREVPAQFSASRGSAQNSAPISSSNSSNSLGQSPSRQSDEVGFGKSEGLSFAMPEHPGLIGRLVAGFKNIGESFKSAPPVTAAGAGNFQFLLVEESLFTRISHEIGNAGAELRQNPKQFVGEFVRGEGSNRFRRNALLAGSELALVGYATIYFITQIVSSIRRGNGLPINLFFVGFAVYLAACYLTRGFLLYKLINKVTGKLAFPKLALEFASWTPIIAVLLLLAFKSNYNFYCMIFPTKCVPPEVKVDEELEKLAMVDMSVIKPKMEKSEAAKKPQIGGSAAKPKPASGGGGGGRNQPTPPSKGVPPQMALTPQIIMPNPEPPKIKNPTLVVASTIYGDPSIKMPNGPIGDPNGIPAPPSSGPGSGAGIGRGAGTGVGGGEGGGAGAGRGGNTGGGDMGIGGGRTIEPMSANLRPTILYKEKAKYTEEARQNKVQGTVVLNVTFTSDGQITNIRTVRGLPDGLTEKAIEAARRIRFQPAVKNGSPVSVRGNLEFTFNLY